MAPRTRREEKRNRGGIAAVALLGLLAAPVAADEQGIDDFPPGKGREETANLCAACHSGQIVSQQGLSRARWDETLDIMTERHKMPKLEGEERKIILDYLAEAFPPKTRARSNPFLKP